jgi:hypothetical protein
MMTADKNKKTPQDIILTAEQEEILDLYLTNLDTIFEEIKESEKMQVEIETLHLKRILST